MTEPLSFTYLGAGDVAACALSDEEILGAITASLRAQGDGRTVIEPRVHLIPESSAHGHFNVLRGVVHPLGLAGVKVVGDFVDNYTKGLPSEMAMLNLFDPDTGMPIAVINATSITDMRTGAVTAIGAKHLAKPDSAVLAHIGARGTAYWNVRLLDHLFDFDEIRVHSRRPESRAAFAARLRADLGKPIVVTDDLGELCAWCRHRRRSIASHRADSAAQDGMDRTRHARRPVRHDERGRAEPHRHHGQGRCR